MTLDGNTRILAHIGWPTATFKAPLIYNPYFASIGVNAAVVPMGVKAEDFAGSFAAIFKFSNVDGALITMPHKVSVVSLLADVSPAVRIAGACNAVKRRADGGLIGDMFDGEGFVRSLRRKGRAIKGARGLIAGSGGVGSAIAASLAEAGIGRLALFDTDPKACERLATRLRAHYPELELALGIGDPTDCDIVVNATPLGMSDSDPLLFEIARIPPSAFVGDVALGRELTPLLAAALARGCTVQAGIDMLFEQIPAYLEFFGFPTTTQDVLRTLARLE